MITSIAEGPEPRDWVKISATVIGNSHQEIRISYNGGGPGWVEAIVKANEKETVLAVWNPYTNKWHTLNLPEFRSTPNLTIDN